MIVSAAAFSEYWQRVHKRTRDTVATIPPDRLDWRPARRGQELDAGPSHPSAGSMLSL